MTRVRLLFWPDKLIETESAAREGGCGWRMKSDQVIDLIMAELRAAQEKHPGWPFDVIHQAAIMAEEAGESIQASIDVYYKNEPIDKFRKEVAQTGAMAIRILMNLQR